MTALGITESGTVQFPMVRHAAEIGWTPRCAMPTKTTFPTLPTWPARPTGLVAESATQEGLGYRTKGVTFDLRTLQALRSEPGPDEAKVFNLVRGLRQEIANEPDRQPVLLPLKERAERILKDLADRTASGLEAMERLGRYRRGEGNGDGSGARQRSVAARLRCPLGTQGRRQPARRRHRHPESGAARGSASDRFPNAAVNADEQR